MKLKRTILAISTIAAAGAVAISVITSCSGVSQAIIDNLVGRGDGTLFAKNSDGSISYSLDNAIHSALTDKNSVASFKKAVVNDALYIWYKNRVDGTGGKSVNISYKTRWDQWNKTINDDYDSKVQSYKNQHNSNWPYYFQNEVLDPVGGTKDAYIYSQLCDKIRSDFVSMVWETTLLGIPKIGTSPISQPSDVARNLDVSPSNNFGLGQYEDDDQGSGVLSKERWECIQFSPYVNVNYQDNDDASQKTYANFFSTLQQTALDMYFDRAHPVASAMALWSYKAPSGGLTKIYDGDIIPNQNTSSSSDGKVGDGKPLDTPSYSFPYFDISHNPNVKGPNEKFQAFAQGFNTDNDSQTIGYNDKNFGGSPSENSSLGLTNISTDFSDDSQPSVYLLSQNNSLNNSYETFAPEILNLFHNQAAETAMPVNVINPKSYSVNSASPIVPDIMKNFLFTGIKGENPLPATGNTTLGTNLEQAYFNNATYGNNGTATWASDSVGVDNAGHYGNLLPNSVIDLASIYENDVSIHDTDAQFGNINHDHIRIFNDQSDWYKKGYRYLVSGVRLAPNPPNATPVIRSQGLPTYLIRNAKGVHCESLYGAPLLTGTAITNIADKLVAEKQLLLYRSLYEKNATAPPMGKGLNIVDADATTGDSAKAFFTANTDDVILKAIKDYSGGSGSGISTTWNEIVADSKFNTDKFNKLYAFVEDTYQFFWMQEIITNYDAANKKLYAWGTTYAANTEFIDPNRSNGDENVIQTIYNNGLGQALPIVINTGTASTGDPMINKYFLPKAKTYYQVSFDNMITDFVVDGSPLTDPSETSLNDLILHIYGSYNDYANNIGGINSFLPGSYSEHILTDNTYVNSLLQTFSGGSSFTNSIKSAAYYKYLSDADGTNFFDTTAGDGIKLGNPNIQDAITSQYLIGQMLKDEKLSYYMNKSSSGALTFDDFKAGLYNDWNYQNSLDSGFFQSTNTHGTGDKEITYWNLLASIKYLCADNYAEFFASLRDSLGVMDRHLLSASNPAYIAWVATENTRFDTSFATATSIESVYGWKANYNNSMENFYTNTNLTSPGDKTYCENKQYYNFANMPTTTTGGTTSVVNAMGFAGIVTKNNHGTLPDQIGNALFSRTKDATNNIEQQGILHKYGFNDVTSFKTWIDAEATNVMSSADINNMAADLNENIIGFGDTYDRVKSVPDDNGHKEEKINAFLGEAEGTWGIDNLITNDVINDSLFKPYNVSTSDSTTQSTFELNNPNNVASAFIPDSADAYQGSRMRAEHISYTDILVNPGNPHDSSFITFNDFVDKFGISVAYNLLVQFASQSKILSEAESQVINYAFGTGAGAIVYDRRMNDLLTKKWVKDYKSDN